ncbi:MAG: hypothetical protein CM1200mP15_18870 [Dehalococcoidia bacterium]|nr:MAG: hypothetical protein CM1200mP15_18870 [Dehalococcoidia bacterium]
MVGPTNTHPRYWGLTPEEYYDACDLWPLNPNGNLILMAIIEDQEGVDNLRDILSSVQGIGIIWAGPGDMAVSMGWEPTRHILKSNKIY